MFIEYVYLILIILAFVMIANKLKIAFPIVLVMGGLLLSFTSLFTHVSIQPDFIFFLFLPPLLYEAAWQVSWKEFWKWRRIIASFAFPVVIITACLIALISVWIIPGFTLPLGFLLGGIISPPDAVSATTIMRSVKVPRRLITVIEGESLLNDASSLIIFRFALTTILTGLFDFQEAAVSFVLVVIMGIATGLVVGILFYFFHQYLPTTPSIEIVLSLITPYCMYYFAERFHFSGVLAVVSGGLFLSNKRHLILTYQSRIQGVTVWTNIVFVLNGLVFMLIGLQLPVITGQLGEITIWSAIGYGLAVSAALIVTRLLCAMGASVFTVFMSRFIKVADPNPGWRLPVIVGWAGMRGVVSLAAALSIPLLTMESQAFPYRNLILFITFIVILVTLVFQGLTLPWVIDRIKPEEKDVSIPEEEQEVIIQKKIARHSIQFLEEKYGEQLNQNEHAYNLYSRFQTDLRFFETQEEEFEEGKKLSLSTFQQHYLQLLEAQRQLLKKMNNHPELDEELIRKYMALIDMEELKLHEKGFKETD